MQIAIDLQFFLSYLVCIQCILSYTQIELNSGFGSHLSKERKTRSGRKNKNEIIENETSLFTAPLVETGATAAKIDETRAPLTPTRLVWLRPDDWEKAFADCYDSAILVFGEPDGASTLFRSL